MNGLCVILDLRELRSKGRELRGKEGNSAVRFAVRRELCKSLCDCLRFWRAPAYVVSSQMGSSTREEAYGIMEGV